MSDTSASKSGFNTSMIGIFAVLAVAAFMGMVALMAWSPELQKRNFAGDHPYSQSSIGYAGAVSYLRARDLPVQVSRIADRLEERETGIVILTLTAYGMTGALDDLNLEGPALLVMPKWTSIQDRRKQEWDREIALFSEDAVELPLLEFDDSAEVSRRRFTGALETPFGTFQPTFIERLQTIEGDYIEPVIEMQDGAILFGRLASTEIFVLSDPDIMNTMGLANRGNAELMEAIVTSIQSYREEPLIFDATLHGYKRSTTPLKLALDVPFIGATLSAIMAALLLIWAAFTRFGSPAVSGREIALGKEALADNTASLIEMAKRERRMTPGYLAMIRRSARRAIGAPRSISDSDLDHLLDRMSKTAKTDETWQILNEQSADPANNRDDLVNKARRLHRWRKEITRND